MAGRVQDKVAFVTGGASGLGLATAIRLGEEGAKVVCVDLVSDAIQAAAEQVAQTGAEAIGISADVTDEQAVAAAVQGARARFGGVDILFANAGINVGEAMVHELELADWEKLIRVNLTGVFLTSKHVLPLMIERGGGAIVLTASIAGLAGVPWLPAYAASKGGVIALGRQMATDYAGYGIRTNMIAPGTIKTPLVIRTFEERARNGTAAPVTLEDRARTVPMGRLGEPRDVANLVLFLVSDESGWVSGDVVTVDGGTTAALVPGYSVPGQR